MKVKTITFKGQPFLYINGAIATKEQFIHGRVSYAHHHADQNVVSRFGEAIGTSEDIVFTGEKDVEVADDAWDGMFDWMSSLMSGL